MSALDGLPGGPAHDPATCPLCTSSYAEDSAPAAPLIEPPAQLSWSIKETPVSWTLPAASGHLDLPWPWLARLVIRFLGILGRLLNGSA